MAARHPVVTGVGIVAAPGCGVDAVWQAISAGADGLEPLRLFESPRYGQVPVGEVKLDLAALGAPRRGSRSDKLGWLAARDAIQSARINFKAGSDRAGVLLGCSVGGSYDSEKFLTTLITEGRMRPRPTRNHECISTVDLIADDFGLFGPCFAVATACSSGAMAIATAAELIQCGEVDAMLAGGVDSLSRMTWGGFHSLLLVDAAGCRPFDAKRGGMSFGEGAAMLVIESEEHAVRRGAKILARLSGWGASCDAHHATAPHPDGAGALAAMQSALRRAELDASVIDYVNAHGTGTRDNDLAESKALKALFGAKVPPFSSTKRVFGHALAASGAIEAVVCIEALRRGELPPNPGFSAVDPSIGLEPVTKLQRAPLTHVMSNSFGFGGNNSVLIFSQPNTVPHARVPQPATIAVTGLGVIGPGVAKLRDIEPPLPAGQVLAHDCGLLPEAAALTPNQRRRLNRMTQMALLAARRSHKPDPDQRVAIALATGFGCLGEGAIFIENLISKNEREPMPMRFPGSVHNAPAAQVALDLAARALNSAPTAGDISFEAALWQGLTQLAVGEADCVLAGAVDELNKYPLAIGKRWGMWSEQNRPGEGAAVAELARLDAATSHLARIPAVRLGRWRKPFNAAREADWIAAAIDLTTISCVMSGAGGWPELNPYYVAVIAALDKLTSRKLEHQTYKQLCGEYHSASAFGFARAVDLACKEQRGVLLYTLCPRGGKALCCIQP